MRWSKIFRNMFGRGKFLGFLEDTRSQYDKTTLTQLQLIGYGDGGSLELVSSCLSASKILENVGNEHEPIDTRPTKRSMEEKPVYMQQKLDMSLNNNLYQGKPSHILTLLNPHPLSPELRLSSEKEEHNSSSVTFTSENLKNALPGVLSLGDTVKQEMV